MKSRRNMTALLRVSCKQWPCQLGYLCC